MTSRIDRIMSDLSEIVSARPDYDSACLEFDTFFEKVIRCRDHDDPVVITTPRGSTITFTEPAPPVKLEWELVEPHNGLGDPMSRVYVARGYGPGTRGFGVDPELFEANRELFEQMVAPPERTQP